MKHSRFGDNYPIPRSEIEGIPASSEYPSRATGSRTIAPKALQRSFERAADCAISLAVILATLPVMLLIYAVLRLQCRETPLVVRGVKPPFGSPITVLKFRTRHAGYPRNPTRAGKFLSDSGLERLPYLFSVLRGDLSFFGNASLIPGSVEQFATSRAELPFSLYANFFKRSVDVLLVLLASPMILLVVGTLYAVVRSDGGAGFFGQRRVGRYGKEFLCWKIRTMQPNAAEMLKQHLAENPEAAKEWEENRKLADDPRITRIGKILRKTSLDEFPQFWNVLKGEMSIVGPRPVPADELRKYGDKDVFYKAVRPGITGLWQVSGRNDISYEERVSLDQTYTKSVGFFSDMMIILKTVDAMLKRTGG
ncbi:sugar transferase [Roseibium sp. MMSF_3412]|uniref:sugar transferase n=1 Tax=Roseibium sp. MMSF_3412 TaxID=3046712 RepID=UPI00273F1021|nr:sugar transferase [Roseibium sp. MMSF_3412]